MTGVILISHVAAELGVCPQYLRILEWEGIIPPALRESSRRLYSELYIALLLAMSVGSWPRTLKHDEEVAGAGL
jgi:MerR-like DNA binding protein